MLQFGWGLNVLKVCLNCLLVLKIKDGSSAIPDFQRSHVGQSSSNCSLCWTADCLRKYAEKKWNTYCELGPVLYFCQSITLTNAMNL